MPPESDQHLPPNEGPSRRLKLVMPASSPTPPRTANSPARHEPSGSPTRPSYSPVTPTFSQSPFPGSFAQSGADSRPQDLTITEPDAAPVSLDDNTDAIAMRAAISILQMQRQQSIKDIKHLERMRQDAAQDPEEFINDLQAGKLTMQPRTGINVDEEASDQDDEQTEDEKSKFGKFPAPQNVVRAPPIEWSKYHIVGEPLDKMHEIQRRYPGFKEEMLDAVQKPQPHTTASPYRPFADKLDDPQTPSQRDDYGT